MTPKQARSSARQTQSPFPRATLASILGSSLSGTVEEQPTPNAQSETVPVTPELPAKSTPSSKAKIDPKLLPELNVYSSPCCGLGDVYGIESALQTTTADKLIFAALMLAKDRHFAEHQRNRRLYEEHNVKFRRFYEVQPAANKEDHWTMVNDIYNAASRCTKYMDYRMKAGSVGMYIFTIRRQIVESTNGVKRLVSFIEGNKLGKAVSQEFYNQNSGNYVHTVLFSVDAAAWEAKRKEWF